MRAEIKNLKAALESADLKMASELIEKAESQLQNYPILIALEGVYYAQRGFFEEALSALAIASQALPRDPGIYYNMAIILRTTGRLVAAEEAIHKALRFSPLSPLVLFELAQIQTAKGSHGEAIMTLLKCIQNANLFFPAYIALTQYLLLDNQPKLAVKLYETAVEGAPSEQFFKDRLQELKGL
ncbi:MAG: tetratricopeptide repeat protein [Myxococcota bacterium]